jgi:hypothetical protein
MHAIAIRNGLPKKSGPQFFHEDFTMKTKATVAFLCVAMLLASTAHADHNSPHGAGWAKMPNDIHNTRIETLGGDNGAFRNFVRYGNGADSVNRYAIDSVNGRSGARTMNRSHTRMMTQSRSRTGGFQGGMGGGRR